VRCIIESNPGSWNVFSQRQFCVCRWGEANLTEAHMHGLIYLIGLIVVIMAILSFFGLR
jgi:hypothetical protein